MWLSQGPHSPEPPPNESGGIGRIGRPTIEVLGAENEMAKRTVRTSPDRRTVGRFVFGLGNERFITIGSPARIRTSILRRYLESVSYGL
jgi:hypothetical protein